MRLGMLGTGRDGKCIHVVRSHADDGVPLLRVSIVEAARKLLEVKP